MTDKLINLTVAAELIGIKYHTLYNMAQRHFPCFPSPVKQNRRGCPLYREADFLAFNENIKIVKKGLDNDMALAFITGKFGWKPVILGGCDGNH